MRIFSDIHDERPNCSCGKRADVIDDNPKKEYLCAYCYLKRLGKLPTSFQDSTGPGPPKSQVKTS